MNFQMMFQILALVLAWIAGKSFLEKIGLLENKEDLQNMKDFGINSNTEAFRIMWEPELIYKIFEKVSQQKKDEIWNKFNPLAQKYEAMTQQILGAKNFIDDTENVVFAQFKKIESLEELAWFTNYYYGYVNNNPVEMVMYYLTSVESAMILGEFLYSFLDPEDFTELKEIVSKYPTL